MSGILLVCCRITFPERAKVEARLAGLKSAPPKNDSIKNSIPMTRIVYFSTLILSLLAGSAAAQDISAPEAFEAARAGKLILIDIRTPPEWQQTGVAQGATRINMIHPQGAPGFLREVLAKTGGNLNAPIALICRTGNRTSQVQRYLKAQGMGQVFNVPEGMAGSTAGPGWLARRLPVENCGMC
jgi:rhodanese-related sulfurtransferase